MGLHVVNISDMKYSVSTEDVIATYSLGSCLGITAYDPDSGIGGMVHCLLPLASEARERARENPFMFVNPGVAEMVRTLVDAGAARSRLVFKVAGGANMRDDNLFNTGARNLAALEKLMDHNSVTLAARDVGDTRPRTMFLHLDTGRVVVRSLGEETEI